MSSSLYWRPEPDYVVIRRDTIARCEQELALINTCLMRGDEIALRLLAYGYRNRPGWKEEWKA